MVQAALTIINLSLIVGSIAGLYCIAIVVADMVNQMKPQHLQAEVRPIEVGKTLALRRMHQLGVEGDWRQYTTQALRAA